MESSLSPGGQRPADAGIAAREGVNWQPPENGPVPDGSVAVTWGAAMETR